MSQPDLPNEYFLPEDGIDIAVIQTLMCRYLGNEARVEPGRCDGCSGFFIRSNRELTTEMIAGLHADSAALSLFGSYPEHHFEQIASQVYDDVNSSSHSAYGMRNFYGSSENITMMPDNSTTHSVTQPHHDETSSNDVEMPSPPEPSRLPQPAAEYSGIGDQPNFESDAPVTRISIGGETLISNFTATQNSDAIIARASKSQQRYGPMNEISYSVVGCLKSLSEALARYPNQALEGPNEVPLALWQDELGRLRVWASNIGAHQTGQSSLDHRLRDASDVKKQIMQLLKRLQRLIQDLEDAFEFSGPGIQLSSDSEEEEDIQSEVQSIYHAFHSTITDLFHMSVVIRRPAQRDRFLGTRRSDAIFYEPFDKQHVRAKFPNADQRILERLGLAISRRRALMRYRERHHLKLGRGLNGLLGDDTESTESETNATEFVNSLGTDAWKKRSHGALSQTSYTPTILQGGNEISIPPRPKESNDERLFECPHCFEITRVEDDVAWARHVFSDLMPYVCVFPDCSTPHRLYESRREWNFHLEDQHPATEDPSNPTGCPLCSTPTLSKEQFERHVGRHLQELALFALPRPDPEEIHSVASSTSQHALLEDNEPQRIDFLELFDGNPAHEDLKSKKNDRHSEQNSEHRHNDGLHSSASPTTQDRETFQCSLCETNRKPVFHSFGTLKRHLISMHSIYDTAFHCPSQNCLRNFARRDKVREHLSIMHQMELRDFNPDDLGALKVKLPSPSTCPVCTEEISTWDILWSHMRNHCQVPFDVNTRNYKIRARR